MADLRIEPLTPDRNHEASAVLARAFLESPVHMAVFQGAGAKQLLENKKLFQFLLSELPGTTEAVVAEGRVIGVCRWVRSPQCHPGFFQTLRMLPSFVRGFGSLAFRIRYWLKIWGDHDPAPRHFHLGPIGVDPAEQGQGIGKVMMASFCEHADSHRTPCYLETDKLENVAFYERFGFQVMEEVPVYDVPTWLMWRPFHYRGPE